MAYRALEVEGRVLSCQAKPSDNKWLQKKICHGFIYHAHFLFVHANF